MRKTYCGPEVSISQASRAIETIVIENPMQLSFPAWADLDTRGLTIQAKVEVVERWRRRIQKE